MTIKALWAVGSKVDDPLAEAAFFEALGAVRKAVERRGESCMQVCSRAWAPGLITAQRCLVLPALFPA